MTGQTGGLHSEWRQGDFALACGPLLFADAPESLEDGPFLATLADQDPAGFVVVSQTCDIVRDLESAPYVAVCPLIEVVPETLKSIEAGRQPRFASLEHAPQNHVADLLRIMSVSKALLRTWARQPGFSTERSAECFARALERVFGRFAFPDSFNECMSPLTKQIFAKHGKNGDIGKAVRSLEELRVFHSAAWDADAVEIAFLLILAKEKERLVVPEKIKQTFEEAFAGLIWTPPFSLANPSVYLGTYDDFSAREYVQSVPLDVNSLSFSAKMLAVAKPAAPRIEPVARTGQ